MLNDTSRYLDESLAIDNTEFENHRTAAKQNKFMLKRKPFS